MIVTLPDPNDPPWTAEQRPVVEAFHRMVREIARTRRPAAPCARPVGAAEYWNRHDTEELCLP
jgi:hypothetical protein